MYRETDELCNNINGPFRNFLKHLIPSNVGPDCLEWNWFPLLRQFPLAASSEYPVLEPKEHLDHSKGLLDVFSD